jgi:hypothetical protein
VAVSLAGIDDPALRSAMADLVAQLGAAVLPDGASASAGIVLVMASGTDELVDCLERMRKRVPGTLPVVLVPFSQPRAMARALALGAAACHALDQPIEHLSATLRALLGLPEQARAPRDAG